MKKMLSVLFSFCLSAAMFSGCNNNADTASFKDGTYKAVYAQADDHGWTEYLVVTVSDGKTHLLILTHKTKTETKSRKIPNITTQ